ncbi:hypothetical protein FQR65_LT02153 [Abscondita terminalis]|nr:hypothetical protein FQR65_LT02153 [Abscondita terminalis]
MSKIIIFLLLLIAIFTNYALHTNAKLEKGTNVKDIVGGKAVPSNRRYPYQVSIQSYKEHFCGGSIISERVVLTAAHCMDKMSTSFLTISAGINDLKSVGAQQCAVKAIFMHQAYHSTRMVNDIAILLTYNPIKFNDKVNKIDIYKAHLEGGKVCKATGWGALGFKGKSPTVLQELTTTSLTIERCLEMQPPGSVNYIYDNVHLCVYKQNGSGLCSGDSGGPLTYDNQLVGIVSWGRNCAVGYPDIFTRVFGYLEWINMVLKVIEEHKL